MGLKIWISLTPMDAGRRRRREQSSQVLQGTLTPSVAPTAWGRRCYSLGMSGPSPGGCISLLWEE